MTEPPSSPRLRTRWRWLLGVGIPTISLLLGIALSPLLRSGWPVPFLLGLAIGPGILAALGTVELRVGRYLAYAVATMVVLAQTIDYWSYEAGNILIALLLIPLLLMLAFTLPIGVGVALGIAVGQWRVVGIRVIHPLLLYLGVAVLAWLLPFGPYEGVVRLPSRHSDAVMEANFWQHREQFEQLVRMSHEDTMMISISNSFTYPKEATALGFTEVRWNQYRSLFRQAGVSDLVRRDDGRIIFGYWAWGLSIGGEYRYYVYSTKPLQPVVDSLDDLPIPEENLKPTYKQITENWYISRVWDD